MGVDRIVEEFVDFLASSPDELVALTHYIITQRTQRAIVEANPELPKKDRDRLLLTELRDRGLDRDEVQRVLGYRDYQMKSWHKPGESFPGDWHYDTPAWDFERNFASKPCTHEGCSEPRHSARTSRCKTHLREYRRISEQRRKAAQAASR